MGGHGGLNILPQKSWNVYNFDNREKVRQDEEAAAKEEQLKREQSRRRDAEVRLDRLRAARGLAPLIKESVEQTPAPAAEPVEPESEPKSGHINLFEGIKIFDPIKLSEIKEEKEYDGKFKRKKMKKEEPAPRVVGPEEETYKLGYGLAGKGVKLPWYLERSNNEVEDENDGRDGASRGGNEMKSVRKTVQELREKRLKRERRERESERALITEKSPGDGGANEVKKSGRKTVQELREERLERERREKERERAVIREKSRRDRCFSRR